MLMHSNETVVEQDMGPWSVTSERNQIQRYKVDIWRTHGKGPAVRE